jgi:2-keto-3-deoxy-L-rhamnonate aldolase RhmA
MRNPMKSPSLFRERLRSAELLLGTFVKTPGFHAVEVLGEVGLDFVVLDAEHAPWDRGSIDVALLAAQSQDLPALVRVSSTTDVLSALDAGAVGVMVPHISDVEGARTAASLARYRNGTRGFSNSTRAGRYGRLSLSEHVELGDLRTTVIAMLEDSGALKNVEELVQVDGLDAFFLGRGDLAVALGEPSTETENVREAVIRLAAAVRDAGKPLCAFIGSMAEVPGLRALGVSAFIVSSDQGFLRQAAASQLAGFRESAGIPIGA